LPFVESSIEHKSIIHIDTKEKDFEILIKFENIELTFNKVDGRIYNITKDNKVLVKKGPQLNF
jgi:hypothetical protein